MQKGQADNRETLVPDMLKLVRPERGDRGAVRVKKGVSPNFTGEGDGVGSGMSFYYLYTRTYIRGQSYVPQGTGVN